jgi:hypothetical protein
VADDFQEDCVMTPAILNLQELARTKLVGRQIDVVGFVDALLAAVPGVDFIRCTLSDERTLRFEFDSDVCEIDVDAAKGKLRMLAARLGVLCNETPDANVSLYGGRGTIRFSNGTTTAIAVEFQNTPDHREFALRSLDEKVAS